MRLHEIESEISSLGNRLEDWAAEHDGDITDFPFTSEMESLSIVRERKLLSMACLAKESTAEAEALEKEAEKLLDRARIKNNAADHLKKAIAAYLQPGEKISDERAALSWRRSESVEVRIEPEKLPDAYRTHRITYGADRAALKEAIKAGNKIEGVEIITKNNLQIQ